MWKQSNATLPTVLIVESGNGQVYIVENVESKPQVEKILNKNEKIFGNSSRAKEAKIEQIVPATVAIKEESDEEIEEHLEYEEPNEQEVLNVPFIDLNHEFGDLPASFPASFVIEPQHEKTFEDTLEPTFDGNWSSDYEDEDLIEKGKKTKRKTDQKKFWKHKTRSLAGKIACKYCDSFFESRQEKVSHACKYLECDPKNFICRICNKELSRNTFSNHLHETLDCPYCGKKFVNPRNMKAHMKNQHRHEKFVQPERKAEETHQEEAKPIPQRPKPKYYKKKEKLECDMCGKYLVSRRSMAFHMNLHTGNQSYICENCGEKFFTPNGIKGHSCEKKRRRPEVDFRIYDCRFCRFCSSSFSSFDENKAHNCPYQHPDDPTSVFCRCCEKVLSKLAFNRHMEIHSGKDWFCKVCNKKLATERALNLHMTTHSGNRPYKCKLCSESFINKVVLDHHMRFHGITTKVFRCDYCSKELSHETSLKNHIKRLHKATAQCELCKQEFATRGQLRIHLESDHKPSVCQICSKSFSLPRYLKMHEKLHFEGDSNRIQCSVCSKFLGMKSIRAHVYRQHQEHFDEWKHANPTLS